jgi:hypothetical protein
MPVSSVFLRGLASLLECGTSDDDNQRAMPLRSRFRFCVLPLLLLAMPLAAAASDKPRPAPPVKAAVDYPMHETHEQEHVTIGAEPCDDPQDCKFFRLEYVQHGFIPVRVIITNDRDEALILDDVRIQFLPADGGKEAAATEEDLNRRLFSGKQAATAHVPIIGIPYHHEAVDAKITNDDNDFGFASTVVPPHSTRAGYVFYDTRGIDDPVLKNAELFLKEIHYTDAKSVRHELFSFTLPFNAFLDAQKAKDAAPAKDEVKK